MKKRFLAIVIAGTFIAPVVFGAERRTGEIGRVSGHSPSSLRCDWASRDKELPSERRASETRSSSGNAGSAK